MIEKIKVDTPSISPSRKHVNKWFNKQDGKEVAPTTKPLDTPEHVKKRLIWVRQYFEILTDEQAPVAYLDEKWFYTTNRRRQIKILPKTEDEAEGIDFIAQPKVRSRRFPVKAMFMGVVGRPDECKKFDGRIHLERISKRVEVKKLTSHQSFCDDVMINMQIKQGDWRNLHSVGATVDEMR